MPEITIPEDDPEPALVKTETVWIAGIVIILALGLSITTNTYHDLHGKSVIPWGIPLAFGISVPLLVALISHTVATLDVHWGFRVPVGIPAASFMAYSANAGIATLTPALGAGWAAVVSVTVDTAAMVFLGILMYAAEVAKRHRAWRRRDERRRELARLTAEERENQDRLGRLRARQQRDNTPGNATGNGQGRPGDNTSGGATGNTPPLPGEPAAGPALPGPEEPPSPGGPDGEDGPVAPVTPIRRPSMTDQEMADAAERLADELEADGGNLSVRAFLAEFGGSASRVTPIVKAANLPARVEARAARRDLLRQASLTAVGE